MQTFTRSEGIETVLKEVQNDPADQAAAIKERASEFLDANNVSMMGGWT